MFGGTRGRLAAALGLVATIAAVTVGCGDDDSTAEDEPTKVAAASEPARVFMERMAKLLATTTDKKDCVELAAIAGRSVTRFQCPVSKEFRKSMRSFEVVGAEEYGTGAIVDYKSGQVKDGAAIVLFVTPTREWGVGRFGIVSKPSTKTSDSGNRDGYAKIVDEYLTAVRERDCDTYFDITFNGEDKKAAVCKNVFPSTAKLAKRLERDPNAEPKYEGGNEAYGFYSLETAKPKPESVTISIAKTAPKSPRPFVILDVTPGPTAADLAKAQKAFDKGNQSGGAGGMKPSDDAKPSEPAVKQ
jgi:hypothetical protein